MEMSNKTLSLLLVAAIAISLFGTIISVNKLSKFQTIKTTTGFATSDQGTATVYINSSTSIFFYVDTVNFGTGYVNGSAGAPQNCTMNSEGLKTTPGCIEFNTVTQGFVLENEGTTIPSVQLSSDSNASEFLTGATWDYGGPQFLYKVTNNETSACTSPVPATYTNINDTAPGTVICSGLDYQTDNDTLKIDIQINIPITTTTGQKTAILTAQAS